MKIEIDYNGSIAKCWITEMHGHPDILRPFKNADEFSQIFALDAFRTIKEDWERARKINNDYGQNNTMSQPG